MFKALRVFSVLVFSWALVSCAGYRTFNDYARAGDTVAVAAGWKRDFNTDNITVTITPSIGANIIIPPADPAIRASVNLYPDPVSNLVVSRETGVPQTTAAKQYAAWVSDNFTAGDKDWWQTVVFVDLPSTLPLGEASVTITNSQGQSATLLVNIINGVGVPSGFQAELVNSLSPQMLASLQRAKNYEISFAGTTAPAAIEVSFLHDNDSSLGGVGLAHVINPTGYLKNLSWSDTGSSLKVMLVPSTEAQALNIQDYKFYVVGGIQNLLLDSVYAFDLDGNPVYGVTAQAIAHD